MIWLSSAAWSMVALELWPYINSLKSSLVWVLTLLWWPLLVDRILVFTAAVACSKL